MSSDPAVIVESLKSKKVNALHATNGVFGAAKQMVVPTTMAGFQYIHENDADKNAALFVALNSDKSMQDMLKAKNAPRAEYDALEDQYTRMRKIMPALATQFPDRMVTFAFYDAQDPVALYEALHTAGFGMRGLHKWGYGTGDNPKPILGAEFFEKVNGFPFPNSVAHMKPAFWDVTPEGQKGVVQVVDLTKVFGAHGAPYLSAQNEMLMPVKHPVSYAAGLPMNLRPKAP